MACGALVATGWATPVGASAAGSASPKPALDAASITVGPGVQVPTMADELPTAGAASGPSADELLAGVEVEHLVAGTTVTTESATATFIVTYNGFTAPAQAAFQAAVDIWASSIQSSVPIKVTVDFAVLGSNVLGSAGPANAFSGAFGVANTWYPSALADSIAGLDICTITTCNAGSADITASFSSNQPAWYFGTDGNPGGGQYDFVSVALHELGHGLGFLGSARIHAGQGSWGDLGKPWIYDRFTERGDGTALISRPSPSAQLATDLTSNDVWFDGPHTKAANSGTRARIYAPGTYSSGSTYGHLDEVTFNATPSALMTFAIAAGEVQHSPGPVTLGIFEDMGWSIAPQVPGAPTGVTAVAGVEQATVSWTPPAETGGSPITGYRVVAQPGGATAEVGAVTNTVLAGLPGGQQYTFTVAARNSAGYGADSAASNAVTPTAAPVVGRRFHPVDPFRAYDSRDGSTPVGLGGAIGQTARVVDLEATAPLPATASAVVANVTVTGGTAGSFLTVYPNGEVRPLTANLNFSAGQTVPNLVTAKLGTGGALALYNAVGTVHVIIDVVGYYDDGADPTADLFTSITPTRALDSRDPGTAPWTGSPLGAGQQRDLVVAGVGAVPGSATAVVANVTVTGGTAGSYLQAFPTGTTQPTTANVLFGVNQTVPNLVTVKVGAGGAVTLFNQLGAVHVIVDVVGYYDNADGGLFVPTSPIRALDSRNGTGGFGTPWSAGTVRTVGVAGTGKPYPVGVEAVVMNTTVTQPTAASFLAAFPADVTNPGTANLLFGPGQTVPNLVVTGLSAGGGVALFNQLGTVHVIGDLNGYFVSP